MFSLSTNKENLDIPLSFKYTALNPGGKLMKIRNRLLVLNLLYIAGIIGTTAIMYYEQHLQNGNQQTVQSGI
jgi:hypothetical protein